MSQTIWTIESGQYSDYTIHGVYSTKEKAQKVLDRLTERYDRPWIEERQLDPLVEEIDDGRHPWQITMDSDGTVERCERSNDPGTYEAFDGLRWWPRSTAPAYRAKNVLDAVTGHVWARDREHAIKITGEFRAREKANR